MTIDFGEVVSGFVSGDVTVTGGTVSGLVDHGDGSFTATVDADADGAVTVSVAADVASDAAGNPNTAATPYAVTVDTTGPTVSSFVRQSPSSTATAMRWP